MIDRMHPGGPRKAVATWEHIINDESIVTVTLPDVAPHAIQAREPTNSLIGLVGYCEKHGINRDSVAEVVKEALKVHAEPL